MARRPHAFTALTAHHDCELRGVLRRGADNAGGIQLQIR
jgi:hypothetical protein